MKIPNLSTILIGTIFALFVGSTFAMEEQNQIFPYQNVFCSLKTSDKNSKIGCLQNSEGLLFNKFFFQLIEHLSPEEKKKYAGFNNNFEISQEEFEKSAGKEFLRMETQYRQGNLLLATAINEIGQLQGAMFFYAQNNDTEVIIKSLIVDNIKDKGLYLQTSWGMLEIIGNCFPNTCMITTLERTVPKILESTLEEIGFEYTHPGQWILRGKNTVEEVTTEVETIAPESGYEKSIAWLKSWFW